MTYKFQRAHIPELAHYIEPSFEHVDVYRETGKHFDCGYYLTIDGRVMDIFAYPDAHRHATYDDYVRCCSLDTAGVSYTSIEKAHAKAGVPWKRG